MIPEKRDPLSRRLRKYLLRLIVTLGVASLGMLPSSAAADELSDSAYALINSRTQRNENQFYVYVDMDSGLNHGFPSGLWGNAMGKLHFSSGCVYDISSPTGCSSDPAALDKTRGNVFQVSFSPLAPGEFVGLNFEEPEHWGATNSGIGYDLRPATQVVFDMLSPTGSISVQFSVAGHSTVYMAVPQQWTRFAIDLSSLGLSSTELSNVNLLFGIASNDKNALVGGTVLLDNIHFEPVPSIQATLLGFPAANQVFGINHVVDALSGPITIPPDQVNNNLSPIYETSLALRALVDRGQPQDLANAKLIADSLVYALGNDNQGDPLPLAPDGSAGLHNAMMTGDLGLHNTQGVGAGQQGQVRLGGFIASALCPQTGFCLVLDGATGGNNSFAILALLAAYNQFQDIRYLNAAVTIGDWVYGNLLDTTGTGFGGYFLGYPDEGLPKVLQTGKSTENNADIFAAFAAIANFESALGDAPSASTWATRANIAGDFVMAMFDAETGHFFAGTVPPGQPAVPGIHPDGQIKGNDVINTFDFLDSQTFTTLAMAPSPRYSTQIDWRLPIRWMATHFTRSVGANGLTFEGFDLIEASDHSPDDGPAGIAWEFTGQAAVAMQTVDAIYGSTEFSASISNYNSQIAQAQVSAPFGDGQGVVAAVLQNGETIAPYQQCLVTPFQCIAERVGLAATLWAIFADASLNPMGAPPVPVCTLTLAPAALYFQGKGGQASLSITTNIQACNWAATATPSWITLAQGSGMGSQTVEVTVPQNTSGYPSGGTIMVNGQSVQVTERETNEVFTDVPPDAYYFDAVNLMKAKSITAGCGITDYCPLSDVTRAQMAVFLVRAVLGRDDFSYSHIPYFNDVQPSDFGFAWIQKLYELKITSGCGVASFCPNNAITRAQMAVFIIRARYGSGTIFDYSSSPFFTDVPASAFAYKYIQRMKQDNITSGCSGTAYCPDNLVTRGDMAVFIMRGAFNALLAPNEPIVNAVTPMVISNGATATLTITGLNTNFVSGATQLNAVPGLVVNSVTVIDSKTLTANVTANAATTPQQLSIWVTNPTEEAVLPNGLVAQ